MTNSVIRCDNVTLGYGNDVILEDVFLDIPRGVFLPFIGPNGAGKTTLLRGILGLLKPMKGKITVPFGDTPAGYVPQHKSVDPLFPLTAREIIAMGLYSVLGWWKKPGPEERRRIDEALDELNLAVHAEKNYRDLSGGTKQKVLVARAFVTGADIFIMDEPTAELDEASENEVFRHLSDFVAKRGKTVLMAHHGLNRLIESSATEVVCLVSHGKVRTVKTGDVKSAEGRA